MMETRIPVEIVNDRPNVEYGESILVTFKSIEYRCTCVGCNRLQPFESGKWDIKTDIFLDGMFTNKVPMECVEIIITPREALLRKRLAELQTSE